MTGPGHRDRYAAAVLEAERHELAKVIDDALYSFLEEHPLPDRTSERRAMCDYIARAVVESGWPNGPVRPDPVSEDDLWRGYGLGRRIAARGGVDR